MGKKAEASGTNCRIANNKATIEAMTDEELTLNFEMIIDEIKFRNRMDRQ